MFNINTITNLPLIDGSVCDTCKRYINTLRRPFVVINKNVAQNGRVQYKLQHIVAGTNLPPISNISIQLFYSMQISWNCISMLFFLKMKKHRFKYWLAYNHHRLVWFVRISKKENITTAHYCEFDEIDKSQPLLNMNIERNFEATLWRHRWRHHHKKLFWHNLGRSFHIWGQIEAVFNVSKFSKWTPFWARQTFLLREVIPEVDYTR